MPAELSLNKVRVTRLLGGDPEGLIDPKAGQVTQYGKILSLDSGNYTVVVGGGSGDFPQRFHPHMLQMTEAYATGAAGGGKFNTAWPTGDGSVLFGRKNGLFANGVPTCSGNQGFFIGGDGAAHIFVR